MKKLLWLDDIRNPFMVDWLMCYAPDFDEDRENVVWVKNYEDFVTWIKENGLPYKVAFDHDLGANSPDGKDAANWMVDYCLDNGLNIPLFTIQSANPTGADNIRGLLISAAKHINK